MNKSILMTQYKELYGGFYIRNNGRWYWKANQETPEIGPISGFWLMQKINEAKNRPLKPIQFTKIEESTPVVQPEPETPKVEVKEEKPKKPASKKPAQKKPEPTTETAEPKEGTEAN